MCTHGGWGVQSVTPVHWCTLQGYGSGRKRPRPDYDTQSMDISFRVCVLYIYVYVLRSSEHIICASNRQISCKERGQVGPFIDIRIPKAAGLFSCESILQKLTGSQQTTPRDSSSHSYLRS